MSERKNCADDCEVYSAKVQYKNLKLPHDRDVPLDRERGAIVS